MSNETKVTGRLGEEIASKFLKKHGYTILERNFTTNFAEADIIALYEDTIVIVEVKTRKNFEYTSASQSVNNIKQVKLKNLGLYYIDKWRLYDYNLRFDIIECYWQIKKINHIINAF
ncbi:YraN family protein [Helcococcus kunzii]|uniref:YraN family protein n=1 Tax=Helcococcus kunzii TaxID=40091 RepID=UPI0024AC83D2|nr:YraN family protein [Helcococcus kunzii]